MKHLAGSPIQRVVAIVCSALLPFSLGMAQTPAGDLPGAPAPPGAQQGAPLLSPDILDNLVAPVALYPDPLLGQILAASTYPLEIVEAEQWLQQNSNLQGAQRIDAAKQQNWDPSVQALVAFPDALKMLSSNVSWITDLGNAFLAQPQDVMAAVQRMRARARTNGKLATTAQQVVTTETQGDQSAIEIQPANPQVIYVPEYNPVYVWGPPVWGAYPPLWYPAGFGWGFGFGPGVFLSSLFPGLLGFGGWGWGLGWLGGLLGGLGGLFINSGFFSHFGFHGGFGGGFAGRALAGPGFAGRTAWAHDPGHRMGVPYPNRAVASQFHSTSFTGSRFSGGGATASRGFNGANAGRVNEGRFTGSQALQSNRGALGSGAGGGGWNRFSGGNGGGTSGMARSFQQEARNFGGGSSQGYRSFAQNERGYNSGSSYRGGASYGSSYSRSFAPSSSASRGSNYSAARNYSAPSRSSSAPRSFSAPHSSGGGSHFSSGHASSGGHSRSSGGHSGGGGGHHR